MTIGSVEPLKKLHAKWDGRVQLLDILTRQAHPGPGVRPYRDVEEKLADARRYQQEEGIPWPVLVDDLLGVTHQVYGGLADPTYLLDIDGRVAFYQHWTHAPTLDTAIEALRAQGGRGVVLGGIDRTPHLTAALTDGWRGLRRGTPQSVIDLETSMPGSGVGFWAGYQARPLLAPLTLRAEPLGLPVKPLLAAGALLLGVWVLSRARANRRKGAD